MEVPLRQESRPALPDDNRRDATISVAIADDDARFRTAMSALLRTHGLQVTGTAGDGASALALVAETTPDVVLMDYAMPGLSGVETTRRLAAMGGRSAVLMLTSSTEAGDVITAMAAGACGYVLKGTSPASLVADIRAAAAGECVMSASVAAEIFRGLWSQQAAAEPSPGPTQLSKRELEVLTMLADGKQNSEIATALVLSPYTVRNHISKLLRKLQLENRTQAAMYAARHGVGQQHA